MITEAELIVDRRRLKRRLIFWRIAAVVLAVGGACRLVVDATADSAQVSKTTSRACAIDGLITGDQATLDLLDDIANSRKVKALIIRIDSPGGTTAGSEALYEAIREIAKDRPVVAVMDTVAASGGYITAIAADHIVARGNTITGSIGVIFTFPEVSRLLDTLGVKMEEIKSGELKAEPSPYKPVSDKVRAVSKEMVQDAFAWFTGLVAERRKLPIDRVQVLADGRVYTGRQAVSREARSTRSAARRQAIDLAGNRQEDRRPTSRSSDWAPAPALGASGLGFSALAGRCGRSASRPCRQGRCGKA